MTIATLAQGVLGIVRDGFVGDTEALRNGSLLVFAHGPCAQACTKTSPAWIHVPISMEGVTVRQVTL